MDAVNISQRVLQILSAKSDTSETLSNLVKAVHVPKKTLNHELYRLQQQNVIKKIQDTPPIWKLLKTETGEFPTIITDDDGGGAASRRRSTRGGQSREQYKTSYKSPNKLEFVVTKNDVQRVRQFLQGRKKPTKSLEIAKALGFSKAADINKILYFMEKKKVVEKQSGKPLSWILVQYGETEHEMFDSVEPIAGMNINTANMPLTGQLASAGGGLPAFQDTVLFNTDLSYESDDTEPLSADENVDNFDVSTSDTGGDEATTPVKPDTDSIVDTNSSMDALSKFTSLQQSQLWNVGSESNTAVDSHAPVSSVDHYSDREHEEMAISNEPFVDQSRTFRQSFRVDEPMSGASSLESASSSTTVESPEIMSNSDSLLLKASSEIFAATVLETTKDVQDSNTSTPLSTVNSLKSGSCSVLQTPVLVDMILVMENERSATSQTSPALVEQNTDDDVRMESLIEDIEEPLPGFKEDTSDSDESDTFANELRKFTTGNTSKRFKAESNEAVNENDHVSFPIHLETNPRRIVLDLSKEVNSENITSMSEASNKQYTAVDVSPSPESSDSEVDVGREQAGKQMLNIQSAVLSPAVDLTDKETSSVLKALSSCPMFSGTAFVLKMKTKLTGEKIEEIMENLKLRNLVLFNSRKLWELTEEGRKHANEGSVGSGDGDTRVVLASPVSPPPKKRPTHSGPPPSPFAIIKQKGTAGLDQTAVWKSGLLNDPQKPSVIPKTSPATAMSTKLLTTTKQQSAFASTNQRVANELNATTTSAASNQMSSFFPLSQSSITKPVTSLFPASSGLFKSTPNQQIETNPKPLMSLNVDSQPVKSTVPSNMHTSIPSQNMPPFQNSPSSVMQTLRQGQAGMTGVSSNVKNPSLFGSNNLFEYETSKNASGFQDSQSSMLHPQSSSQYGMTGVSSNIQKLNALIKKPLNTPLDPPPQKIPEKYADYPNQKRVTVDALKGGFANRDGASKVNQQSGAFAKRPPPSPADMLAKVMKKTEISPPPSHTSFTQSSTGSFQTASSSSVRQVPQTPQSLLGLSFSAPAQAGSYPSVSATRTSMVTTTTQSVTRNLLNLANQSGIAPLPRPTTTVIQAKPVSNIQPALALSTETFNALNKNPVSALMEYAQSRKMVARIEVIGRHGASHKPKFQMAAFVGSRQFPTITCLNKKDGKKEACDLALRTLVAEKQFNQSDQGNQLAKPMVAPSNMTHFDTIAALTHRGFTALVSQIASDAFAGRKVIAGLVMKRSQEDTGVLVSLGTGNRCITGNQLSLEGNTVNDSHAEIITRRGFIRFLYSQLEQYNPDKPSPMFERSPSGKLRVKQGITFHLYISTAPCGDGALFSPRDAAANASQVDARIRPPHEPTFTSNVQGLLRTKVEGGEGTIPIDPGFKGQTFDGIQRGERLLTMSCTDKVCRWNVVGMQGALLSHFLDPVYLDSFTLGMLYDHGHLARALCCRVAKSSDIAGELPPGYRLNHPWLGRVTACEVPRELQKTKSLSINWSFGDTGAEVTDGTLGLNYTSIEKSFFSRCSKRNLYDSFKKICGKFGRHKLLQVSSYKEAKMAATDFQAAREAMLRKFRENKCGVWVSKPVEEEMFN